jgi:hypothetical protein
MHKGSYEHVQPVVNLGRFRKPDLHGDERVSVSGFSTVAGLKSVQSDRKRNFEKANPPKADKYRIMNVECRSDVFCLF